MDGVLLVWRDSALAALRCYFSVSPGFASAVGFLH